MNYFITRFAIASLIMLTWSIPACCGGAHGAAKAGNLGNDIDTLQRPHSREIMNWVSVCNLVHDPERYAGIPVYVSSTYLVGFESSMMYCLGCPDSEKIWVEFGPYYEFKNTSVPRFSTEGAYDVIFSGRFYTDKGYGHLNAYRYQFVVEFVKRAKLISRDPSDPGKWPIKTRKKVCGYEEGLTAKRIMKASSLGSEIHDAAKAGNLAKVKALLEDNHALVFGKDNIGETPLHWAVHLGYKDAAGLLLDKGAEINARDNLGGTPLHLAAGSGYTNVVKLLLDKDAEVNAKNLADATPLYMAYRNRHVTVVEVLRKHGGTGEADWSLIGIANQSDLIQAAAKAGDIVKISDMLKEDPTLVFARDKFGKTPLHWAANMGYKDEAELLLDGGADINAKDNFGDTPLHLADHEDVIKLLLNKGAEVNAKDNEGRTPLFWASRHGRRAVVDVLHKHGGVGQIDRWTPFTSLMGITNQPINISDPIFEAAEAGGFTNIKALLLDNPKLVFSKDRMGETALHWAACFGHKDVVDLLLDKGAEINAKDLFGHTPLHQAAANGRMDVAELLLNNGAEVDARDAIGETVLAWAANVGNKDAVKLLLDNGAEVNVEDERGMTPFQWAVKNGYKEVAELLLARKAEINATDKMGNTALHMAAEGGYTDVVKLLLTNGAKVTRNNFGDTPLKMVYAKGHKDLIKLLRKYSGLP
jgi:ankyrin repeat protein